MKKKFGQNFLKNQNVIENIINLLKINEDSLIYEVGPGDGSLTKEIIKKKPKFFLAVEIDKSLKSNLDILFVNKNYKLIFDDAIKFDETNYFKKNATIIANLPYNISLKLLIKWIFQYLSNQWFSEMILMFQKEVGERLTATENSKKYGRITLLSSAVFEIKKICDISKKDFFPSPKVDSSLLSFKPLKNPHFDKINISKLEFLAKTLFSNRRKKVKNKFNQIFNPKIIEEHNLKKYYNLRAENIDKNTFFYLAKLIN